MAIVLNSRQAMDLRIALLDAASSATANQHFNLAEDYTRLYDLLAAAGSITLGDDFALVASADEQHADSFTWPYGPRTGKWHGLDAQSDAVHAMRWGVPSDDEADRQQADDERRNAWRAL